MPTAPMSRYTEEEIVLINYHVKVMAFHKMRVCFEIEPQAKNTPSNSTHQFTLHTHCDILYSLHRDVCCFLEVKYTHHDIFY